jgi:Questin oxidase-like
MVPYSHLIFTSLPLNLPISTSGLSTAAVHADFALARIPPSFFETSSISNAISQTAARLKSVMLSEDAKPASSGLHTFSILARILKDPEFGTIVDDESGIYANTVDRFGDALKKLIDQWQVDTTNPQDVERKIEELSWMNVMIYGIGGWQKGQPFNADFFL